MKEQLLAQLRDKALDIGQFRSIAERLSSQIASEVAQQIRSKRVILIPILRAGIAFLPAFQRLFPRAPIGFLGIQREEKTAKPHLYYQNLPPITVRDHILILDPMLATGGSANLAIRLAKVRGAVRVTVVGAIAAPEGLRAVKKRHPDVGIYTVAIDEKLDAQKFIFPGLGDFGDRYFGTTD